MSIYTQVITSPVTAPQRVVQYRKAPESLGVPIFGSKPFPPSEGGSYLPPFSLGQLACLTAALEEIGSVDYQARGGS